MSGQISKMSDQKAMNIQLFLELWKMMILQLWPGSGKVYWRLEVGRWLTVYILLDQAWSITYHSWLTFVLLLWACLIWITPFARWFCMVSSPGLVIYAELLLLVQYVYGLQLTNDELPLQDPTGTFDYSELGLKKWQFPCLHLGAQVGKPHCWKWTPVDYNWILASSAVILKMQVSIRFWNVFVISTCVCCLLLDALYLGVLGDVAATHQREENEEKGKREWRIHST